MSSNDNPSEDTEQQEQLPEEQYSDHVGIEVTEYANIRIESEILRLDLSTYDRDLQTGVHITRDGSNIALSAGTVGDEDTPHIRSAHSLTPEQARVIGDALHEAADRSEEITERTDDDTDTEGFLRGLLG